MFQLLHYDFAEIRQVVFKFVLMLIFAVVALPSYAANDSILLVPVGLVRINGAFGSIWQTELTIRNDTAQDVQVLTAGDLCVFECAFAQLRLKSGQAKLLSDPTNGDLAALTGLIFRIASTQVGGEADVHFNLRVQDLSKQASTWGTELPVVRASQFTTKPIQLLNLPTDPNFRFTIRVYAVDGSDPILGRARIYDLASGNVLREIPLTLQRQGQVAHQNPQYYPAYAQIDSLGLGLSSLSGRVGIEIIAIDPSQNLWAFATVTNNDTQHMTTVTPH